MRIDEINKKFELIDFLIYLNEKKLINNFDFDYEEEAKLYLKQLKEIEKL